MGLGSIFLIAPFHKNPPSFNMLLLSNGQDKNERKLNGLKHLFRDLVTLRRHMTTRSPPGGNPATHLWFKHFWQWFPFFVFSCLETKSKFPHFSHKKIPWHRFTKIHQHLICYYLVMARIKIKKKLSGLKHLF
jgi:hypothetical protein